MHCSAVEYDKCQFICKMKMNPTVKCKCKGEKKGIRYTSLFSHDFIARVTFCVAAVAQGVNILFSDCSTWMGGFINVDVNIKSQRQIYDQIAMHSTYSLNCHTVAYRVDAKLKLA